MPSLKCKCYVTSPSVASKSVEFHFSYLGIKSFLLYAKETEIRGHMFTTDEQTQALAPISNIDSASAIDFHAGKTGDK